MTPASEIAQAIADVARRFHVPHRLVVAWTCAASGWKPRFYKYDPNYDAMYIGQRPIAWGKHPEWLEAGPTAAEFFAFNPDRAPEALLDVDYGFVAQTRISAQYGIFGLLYPVAMKAGFRDAPEALQDLAYAEWALAAFQDECEWATQHGFNEREGWQLALARIQGDPIGNRHPKRLTNKPFVQQVDRCYRELYGERLFDW
jgi:hypothetical protein